MNPPERPQLRAATQNDAREIAALIRRSFRKQVEVLQLRRADCPEYVGFETAERVRRRMQPGCHILVAVVAGQLIGTVAYGGVTRDSSRGEIARLAILPPRRREGLGHVLMEAAEAALGRLGATVAEVSIVAQFTRLRSWYEAMGYEATRTRRFDALPFEVLFMEKKIP